MTIHLEIVRSDLRNPAVVNRMLQQTHLMRLIGRMWMVVAFAIALGGMKSYGLQEIVHSHPHDPTTAHDYVAGDGIAADDCHQESSPVTEGEAHSHWLPTVEEAPAMAGFDPRVRLIFPLGGYVFARWSDLRGPERPTDLLKRPPRLG